NLVNTARSHPDHTAVRVGDAITTYRELDQASSQVAGLLRARGVSAGDPVGLMLPNVAEFAVIYYGILRPGGAGVPMNPLLKATEVAYYLGDSGAKLMFAWHGFAAEAQAGARQADAEAIVVDPVTFAALTASAPQDESVLERDADDLAVILYTSGTTGSPKGAELTHDNLIRNAEVVCSDLIQLTADDVIFGGLPLFHAFGQTCALNAAMASGASVTMLPRFAPDQALQILSGHGVTVF